MEPSAWIDVNCAQGWNVFWQQRRAFGVEMLAKSLKKGGARGPISFREISDFNGLR
jgi:hypothetical protein